ncbi:MAG: GNAT family N-acetyltransferase [Jatrophihabitantaceae bacterium]
MPTDVPDEQLISAHSARLLAIDPLLGLAPASPAVDDAWLGGGAAEGLAGVRTIDEQTLEAVWGKLERFVLKPFWSGDSAALDALLTEWAATVRADRRSADEDSQVAIAWPSRDLAAARVFLRHGLVPATALAIRPAGRPTPARPAGELLVRRAGPDDLEPILALGAEELAYEEGISVLTVRPGHTDQARAPLAHSLAGESPWLWVAQSPGGIVGALTLNTVAESTWIADQTSVESAAYLPLLSVAAEHRAGGAGSALVAAAHAQLDAAGVGATLLHYGSFNPLSVPFWSRMGYRPLWTYWEAFPAHHVR